MVHSFNFIPRRTPSRRNESSKRGNCRGAALGDVLTADAVDALMLRMRTTVTLDSDTEALLRQEITLRRVTFKAALNEAIRRGLQSAGKIRRPTYRVKPFRSGYQPGVDRLRLNQLADQLETENFLRVRNRHK